MNANDIAAHHRSRLAFIYVRQSSPHQVLHHRESQLRQRSFRQRAADLGWPLERITVIDEDLGVSATKRRQDRTGFQNMVAEAALGHVGIILALELSRLSRTNQDWYHLLDICAVTGTLLADEEALYDPRAYNDRLLLGLKGTMSEAEIHIMKQRLVEAMHAKAKRGEFCFRLPSGYPTRAYRSHRQWFRTLQYCHSYQRVESRHMGLHQKQMFRAYRLDARTAPGQAVRPGDGYRDRSPPWPVPSAGRDCP